MSFLSGNSGKAWQPVTTGDTTTTNYWLNWRVLICSICLLIALVFASIIISKKEGPRNSENGSIREDEEEEEPSGIVYEDEVWKPCLKGIHPGWLLAFRALSFLVLLILLILNVAVDGGSIFFFYTQWTFTMVTIYFGLGSILSMYGCYQYHNKIGGGGDHGSYASSADVEKYLGARQEQNARKIAGFWGYLFQVIFQMNAGAVILTDCVFWFILVPFLAIKNYDLNFLMIDMHTINVVFLLGDTALNSLRFPWFRISYFFLWTIAYVVFQWILHACVSLWWPYPFLDLSSPFSPLWYSTVALMHIPCYGVFVLVVKLKHHLLSKWFPRSFQCPR